MRPPANKTTPTASLQSQHSVSRDRQAVDARWGLTIELDGIVPDALKPGPAAALGGQNAFLLGLAKVELQHEIQRRSDDGEDDGKGSKAPSPANVLEKRLGRLGSGEGGDDVGGRGKGVRQASVLELGGIGSDDIDTEGHAAKAQVVEDLRRQALSAYLEAVGVRGRRQVDSRRRRKM